jgi:hypothetical protein
MVSSIKAHSKQSSNLDQAADFNLFQVYHIMAAASMATDILAIIAGTPSSVTGHISHFIEAVEEEVIVSFIAKHFAVPSQPFNSNHY